MSLPGEPLGVPLPVLTVASWFPDHDAPVRGRFVADQVEAVAATGRIAPTVVTFQSARLSGGARTRSRQAAAVGSLQSEAIRTAEGVVANWTLGTIRLPIVRLTIAGGDTRETGAAGGAVHRRAGLDALADRLIGGGPMSGVGIVHAHTGFPDGAAAVRLADRLGWPLIVTEHASFLASIWADPARRGEYRTAVARASRVLAVSEMLAAEIRSAFPEFAGRVEVLANAVPLDRFRTDHPDGRAADELLFVGSLKASKGIETLLRATALARATRPTIRLRMIGNAPNDATARRWEELAGQLGLAGAVSVEPAADRTVVARAMARASLFVHPSPRETFGVVAVEALASGTPVVAVDSGGVTEILGADPGRVGALVRDGSPEALAGAILATLERRTSFDPKDLRASVADRFGADAIGERLAAIYEGVAAASNVHDTLDVGARLGRIDLGRPRDAVLVALDRRRAEMVVAACPPAVRTALTLLTEPDPAGQALPHVGRVVAVDTGLAAAIGASASRAAARARSGRLRRLLGDPVATVGRLLGRDPGSAAAVRPASHALDRLSGDPGLRRLVPLDGHDHLVAAGLVGRRGATIDAAGWPGLADPPTDAWERTESAAVSR